MFKSRLTLLIAEIKNNNSVFIADKSAGQVYPIVFAIDKIMNGGKKDFRK
jgi:hypothetical protein